MYVYKPRPQFTFHFSGLCQKKSWGSSFFAIFSSQSSNISKASYTYMQMLSSNMTAYPWKNKTFSNASAFHARLCCSDYHATHISICSSRPSHTRPPCRFTASATKVQNITIWGWVGSRVAGRARKSACRNGAALRYRSMLLIKFLARSLTCYICSTDIR